VVGSRGPTEVNARFLMMKHATVTGIGRMCWVSCYAVFELTILATQRACSAPQRLRSASVPSIVVCEHVLLRSNTGVTFCFSRTCFWRIGTHRSSCILDRRRACCTPTSDRADRRHPGQDRAASVDRAVVARVCGGYRHQSELQQSMSVLADVAFVR
jgi:hypothetical protein